MKNNSGLLGFGVFILIMLILIVLVFVDIPLYIQVIIALFALISFIAYNRNQSWFSKFKESAKNDLEKVSRKK